MLWEVAEVVAGEAEESVFGEVAEIIRLHDNGVVEEDTVVVGKASVIVGEATEAVAYEATEVVERYTRSYGPQRF